MVKVPATPEGPARDPASDRRRHQHQTSRCCFSQKVYRGGRRSLSRRSRKIRRGAGGDPTHVASRRQFSLSAGSTVRWNKQLDEKDRGAANDPSEKERPGGLERQGSPSRMQKLAYQDYKRLFFPGPRWDKLAAKGAKNRSACCGLRPAPRTRTIAMCSMSRELIGPQHHQYHAAGDARRPFPRPWHAARQAWRRTSRMREGVPRRTRKNPASRSMRSRLTWSRTASGNSPTPPNKLYGAVAHKARHRARRRHRTGRS